MSDVNRWTWLKARILWGLTWWWRTPPKGTCLGYERWRDAAEFFTRAARRELP